MKIKDISPESLEGVPDEELLSLHLRTHQLYGANFGPDAPPDRGYRDDEGNTAVDGLLVGNEIARKIWKDDLDEVTFEKKPGNVARGLFLVSPKFTYGIIRLGLPKEGTLKYPVEYFRPFKVPLPYKAASTGGFLAQKVEVTSDEGPLSLETLVNAHLFILDEMDKRNLKHRWASELDDEGVPTVEKEAGLFGREDAYSSAGLEYWEDDVDDDDGGEEGDGVSTSQEG